MSSAVQESLQRLYDSPPTTCPLLFTEPKPAHADVIKEILINRKLLATGNHVAEHALTRDLGLGDDEDGGEDHLDRHDYSLDNLSLDAKY